jgi:hypothetical protein
LSCFSSCGVRGRKGGSPDGSKESGLFDVDGPRGIPVYGSESCRIRRRLRVQLRGARKPRYSARRAKEIERIPWIASDKMHQRRLTPWICPSQPNSRIRRQKIVHGVAVRGGNGSRYEGSGPAHQLQSAEPPNNGVTNHERTWLSSKQPVWSESLSRINHVVGNRLGSSQQHTRKRAVILSAPRVSREDTPVVRSFACCQERGCGHDRCQRPTSEESDLRGFGLGAECRGQVLRVR